MKYEERKVARKGRACYEKRKEGQRVKGKMVRGEEGKEGKGRCEEENHKYLEKIMGEEKID